MVLNGKQKENEQYQVNETFIYKLSNKQTIKLTSIKYQTSKLAKIEQ